MTSFEQRIYERFGQKESDAYANLDTRKKNMYRNTYRRNLKQGKAICSPSQWLQPCLSNISLRDKTTRYVYENFDANELYFFRLLHKKHRMEYKSHIQSCEHVLPPTQWAQQRGLQKSGGSYNDTIKAKKNQSLYAQIKAVFCEAEAMYFKMVMIDFGKKYYTMYFKRHVQSGGDIQKPSEWYKEFITTTQCFEMVRLENHFFGLVKKHIDRKDAKQYMEYLELMSYKYNV